MSSAEFVPGALNIDKPPTTEDDAGMRSSAEVIDNHAIYASNESISNPMQQPENL